VSGGSSGLRGVFVQTAEEYAEFAASLVPAQGLARDHERSDGLRVPGTGTVLVTQPSR